MQFRHRLVLAHFEPLVEVVEAEFHLVAPVEVEAVPRLQGQHFGPDQPDREVDGLVPKLGLFFVGWQVFGG